VNILEKKYNDDYKYGYSDYNRNDGYYQIEKVIKDADGAQYYVTRDGKYFRGYDQVMDYIKKKDNEECGDFYDDMPNDIDLNPF